MGSLDGLEEDREDSPRCQEVTVAAVRGAAGAAAAAAAGAPAAPAAVGAPAAAAAAAAAAGDVDEVTACSLLGPSLAEVVRVAEWSVMPLAEEEGAEDL